MGAGSIMATANLDKTMPVAKATRPVFAGNRRLVVGILTLVATGFLWWFLTSFGFISPMRLPTPADTYDAFLQIAFDGYGNATLLTHILHSSKLVLIGFGLAVLIGVPLGLAMGASTSVEAFMNPAFLFLRPIPPLAWIPLSIVWLGLGDGSKIMVIFIGAFVPSVINSYTGARSMSQPLVEAAAMLGIGRFRFVTEVLVPGALPMIFTGLRLSLQAAWTTLVAGELIGAAFGLGYILNQASQDIYIAMIVVAMLAVAIMGALMTAVLGMIEQRAMPWSKR